MTVEKECIIDTTLGIKPDIEFIARYLVSKREKHNLSQRQLAELLGFSRNTIKNYETCKSNISDSDWLKVILTFNDHPRFKLTPR